MLPHPSSRNSRPLIAIAQILMALLSCSTAVAQIITTVAGTEWIFPKSVLPALSAPLGQLFSVAADSKGNLYVADFGNVMVMRISPDGILTVVAGNGLRGHSGDDGPATSASLSGPRSVAVDAAGNLYILDIGSARIRRVSPEGIISTIAGDGIRRYTGDGGPAASASFPNPLAMALDAAGNTYVTDSGCHCVRKITRATGVITTIAGTGTQGFSGDEGPARAAQLNTPQGIALDASGIVYFVDSGNFRVRSISPDGTIRTVAGVGPTGASGDGGPAREARLNNPLGVAVDASGGLYISEVTRIRKVTAGIINTIAGTGRSGSAGDGGPPLLAEFNLPTGLALDAKGTLYISDAGNNVLRQIPASGNVINLVAGNGGFRYGGDGGPAVGALLNVPWGVAADAAGNLYIVDYGSNRVRRVTPDGIISTFAGTGKAGYSGDGGLASNATLFLPRAVATDARGNVYIVDSGNGRVRRVAIDTGIITTVAGGGSSTGDGPATSLFLAGPSALAFDASGNFYIGEQARIRKVTPAGAGTVVAGTGQMGFTGDNGPATAAQITLSGASGLAVDASNNLYFNDTVNYRVRRVSAGGTITTIAGTGNRTPSGDGGPATSAGVSPSGLVLDGKGNIFVGDSLRVRMIAASTGIISTIAGNGSGSPLGDGGPARSAAVGPLALTFDRSGNLVIADGQWARVRKLLAVESATLQVAPASIGFTAIAGGAAPAPQTVQLSSPITGLAFTAAANAPWLRVSPSSGTIPASIEVSVDSTGFEPGSYQGSVTITAPNVMQTIAVTLNLSQSTQQPELSVESQSIVISSLEGGSEVTRLIRVSNNGGGTLAFSVRTATASGENWLSVSPDNGNATPSVHATLTVTVRPGSLAPGSYAGTLTVTGAGRSAEIPVTLSITPANRVILVSQSALSFTAVAQGGLPLPQSFGILNTGQGSMSWSASATTLSGGSWIEISPSSGTVSRPFVDVSLVRVSINPAGLAPGDYYGRIRVTASAVNSPQVLTVVLAVLSPGSNPGPEVLPNGLIFTGVAGENPSSQEVLVGNPRASPDSFLSGAIGRGFSYLPTNATVEPGEPLKVRVYPDFERLSGGAIERGTITLQFSDGTPRTISVLSVVAPAGQADASKDSARGAASCRSPNLRIQHRSLRTGFSAVVGQATNVEVQVVDECGNRVGPGRGSAAIVATFSNHDPSINLTHIGDGVWVGTWRPVQRPSTSVVMTVTAFLVEGATTQAGQVDLVGNLGTSAAPTVTAGGVVHAASGRVVPIAPGSLITLYGANLADRREQAPRLPLPLELNGVEVLLGDRPLPLYFTSAEQLNVQVPFDLPANTHHQITVRRNNALSVPEELAVATAQPGIFTENQQGTGQGSIVKSDQVTLARPGTPAQIGDTIVIYCTGLGAVTPPVATGAAAPADRLTRAVNTVTARIGGIPAQVVFAGMAPGSVGYQVNAVVPIGVTPGDQVPVVLEVAGQSSPPVTIAVR